ncbi:hypothetical protein [Hymenobacter cellulosilyticus]|uniref:Uncharacterized protein n=1 Tax=Hymenobacter cellulosilyticus TaxID=2932248 RepID=A0A8T9QEN3_9BACT|nr:hypothetical protein [Hymenobacter cellulosilyticus]UOQ74009.1 hypothetical protein MUN79_09000 [Hymenobacter cellulosilyticus]
MDGLLIEVDSQFPIGKPYGPHTNLVAAVNVEGGDPYTLQGQGFKSGETIYFSYDLAPGGREAFCPQNTIPLPVPHLRLTNVGATTCQQVNFGQ